MKEIVVGSSATITIMIGQVQHVLTLEEARLLKGKLEQAIYKVTPTYSGPFDR